MDNHLDKMADLDITHCAGCISAKAKILLNSCACQLGASWVTRRWVGTVISCKEDGQMADLIWWSYMYTVS